MIPVALVGLFALQMLVGDSLQSPLDHLLAMTLALLILLPLFALDTLGGGDVKLLVAVALWLGTNKLAALLILVGIVGAIFALFWLAMRWLIRMGLHDRTLPMSLQAHAPLPFALPIMIVAVLLFERA
jgi:Flp pilus assembly protein protease CpaA